MLIRAVAFGSERASGALGVLAQVLLPADGTIVLRYSAFVEVGGRFVGGSWQDLIRVGVHLSRVLVSTAR